MIRIKRDENLELWGERDGGVLSKGDYYYYLLLLLLVLLARSKFQLVRFHTPHPASLKVALSIAKTGGLRGRRLQFSATVTSPLSGSAISQRPSYIAEYEECWEPCQLRVTDHEVAFGFRVKWASWLCAHLVLRPSTGLARVAGGCRLCSSWKVSRSSGRLGGNQVFPLIPVGHWRSRPCTA